VGKKSKSKQPPQKARNQSQPARSQPISPPPAATPLGTAERFELSIEFLSDWHVGSGTGRPGDIDCLVRRDGDDVPFIPAKTITGIWRDGCELVAHGLDDGTEAGLWSDWVDYLFGEQPALEKTAPDHSPRPAALSIRPGRFPERFYKVLKNRTSLLEALTFVKPGVSIDPDTGCAKPDFLRFEEMVRGHAILSAQCELPVFKDPRHRSTVYALLAAGAKMVERLGGKRRRGAGRCRFSLIDQAETWLEWLDANPQPLKPPTEETTESSNSKAPATTVNEDSWIKIAINIEARTPLVVAARTVGNVVETLDYIPGTLLLPIISSRLKRWNVNLGAAIAKGDLVVTNATINVANECGQPVPKALFKRKQSEGFLECGGVYNLFAEAGATDVQLKGYRAGYVAANHIQTLPAYAEVALQVETHNTVEDSVQRPTGNIGGVYSYEAIAAGTRLKAELRVRKYVADALQSAALRQNWWSVLSSEERLGQAKKDDYGQVTLSCSPKSPTKAQALTIKNELVLWLQSDVLLRDERLRPTTSILALQQVLEAELDVGLVLRDDDKLSSLFTQERRTDSWQVRWQLPRPSLVGLAAGSCAVFTVEGVIDPVQLSRLETSGIGERRAEGFGQIAFNHPLLTESLSQRSPANQDDTAQTLQTVQIAKTDGTLFEYARLLEREALRSAIQRKVLAVAAEVQKRHEYLGFKIGATANESKPPMSQLGGLRSVLAACAADENYSLFSRWWTHLNSTENRRKKWPEHSLDNIKDLVEKSEQIWGCLEIDFSAFICTRDGTQALKNELKMEAVRLLVDACILAHKRELEHLD
jgi:CRISPR-associated protein Csx10